MIPPNPPIFVGREAELATLAEWFANTPNHPIVLTGLGGIGKSALVSRFVRQRFADKNVAWLSLYEYSDPIAAVDSFVHESQGTNHAIVVIEGVERLPSQAAPQLMRKIRDTFTGIPIIATSRDSIEALDSQSIAIKSLSQRDAVELLKRSIGRTASDAEIGQLAAALGNHPLAIKIASGLAKDTPISDLIAQLHDSIYDLEQQIAAPAEPAILVVQPKIVTATDYLIAELRKRPEDIYTISPRSFEELIAAVLDDMGWEVHLTQETRDGGRDILAYLQTEIGRLLCLVEAKRYSPNRPVGVELVRTLYGTLCHEQANTAMLVTTSHFTAGAREFQQQHVFQIGLKEFGDVVTWIQKYKAGK